MASNFEWERRSGGKRPLYHLRKYTSRDHSNDAWGTQVVAQLGLTSPKRKRWMLTIVNPHSGYDNMYLDRMTEREALSAAKVIVMGYLS